jgi:hypothetical protein
MGRIVPSDAPKIAMVRLKRSYPRGSMVGQIGRNDINVHRLADRHSPRRQDQAQQDGVGRLGGQEGEKAANSDYPDNIFS